MNCRVHNQPLSYLHKSTQEPLCESCKQEGKIPSCDLFPLSTLALQEVQSTESLLRTLQTLLNKNKQILVPFDSLSLLKGVCQLDKDDELILRLAATVSSYLQSKLSSIRELLSKTENTVERDTESSLSTLLGQVNGHLGRISAQWKRGEYLNLIQTSPSLRLGLEYSVSQANKEVDALVALSEVRMPTAESVGLDGQELGYRLKGDIESAFKRIEGRRRESVGGTQVMEVYMGDTQDPLEDLVGEPNQIIINLGKEEHKEERKKDKKHGRKKKGRGRAPANAEPIPPPNEQSIAPPNEQSNAVSMSECNVSESTINPKLLSEVWNNVEEMEQLKVTMIPISKKSAASANNNSKSLNDLYPLPSSHTKDNLKVSLYEGGDLIAPHSTLTKANYVIKKLNLKLDDLHAIKPLTLHTENVPPSPQRGEEEKSRGTKRISTTERKTRRSLKKLREEERVEIDKVEKMEDAKITDEMRETESESSVIMENSISGIEEIEIVEGEKSENRLPNTKYSRACHFSGSKESLENNKRNKLQNNTPTRKSKLHDGPHKASTSPTKSTIIKHPLIDSPLEHSEKVDGITINSTPDKPLSSNYNTTQSSGGTTQIVPMEGGGGAKANENKEGSEDFGDVGHDRPSAQRDRESGFTDSIYVPSPDISLDDEEIEVMENQADVSSEKEALAKDNIPQEMPPPPPKKIPVKPQLQEENKSESPNLHEGSKEWGVESECRKSLEVSSMAMYEEEEYREEGFLSLLAGKKRRQMERDENGGGVEKRVKVVEGGDIDLEMSDSEEEGKQQQRRREEKRQSVVSFHRGRGRESNTPYPNPTPTPTPTTYMTPHNRKLEMFKKRKGEMKCFLQDLDKNPHPSREPDRITSPVLDFFPDKQLVPKINPEVTHLITTLMKSSLHSPLQKAQKVIDLFSKHTHMRTIVFKDIDLRNIRLQNNQAISLIMERIGCVGGKLILDNLFTHETAFNSLMDSLFLLDSLRALQMKNMNIYSTSNITKLCEKCSVKSLNIKNCQLKFMDQGRTGNISRVIKEALSLQKLKITGCMLVDHNITDIKDALKHTKTLIHLDLSHNQLTPKGLNNLALCFPRNKSLQVLKLMGNMISVHHIPKSLGRSIAQRGSLLNLHIDQTGEGL